MGKICSITAFGQQLNVETAQYRNGRLAIQLTDPEDDQSWATFSCNLPDEPLRENEFFAKTWSENEPLREPMLASGKFIDTGRRVRTGFVEAEVWAIR